MAHPAPSRAAPPVPQGYEALPGEAALVVGAFVATTERNTARPVNETACRARKCVRF